VLKTTHDSADGRGSHHNGVERSDGTKKSSYAALHALATP
jgi:hypothetical protein